MIMKMKVLLQNKNNIDRKIWVTLTTTSEEIEEAIDDISIYPDDEYIICHYKIEKNFNKYIAADDDVFELNTEIKQFNEKLNA